MGACSRSALALGLALGLVGPAWSGTASLDGAVFRVRLETGRFGPIETRLAFEGSGDEVRARSLSGILELIRTLPGARGEGVDVSSSVFAWTARRTAVGYAGALTSPWPRGNITFSLADGRIEGRIQGGPLGGSFSGTRTAEADPLRDYPAVLKALDSVVRDRVFEPAELDTEAYRLFRGRLGAIATAARDDLDFLLGFLLAWTNDPFSHFELRRSAVTAEAMAKHFDGLRIGKPAARVTFDGDLAVLRVDTMMGIDTVEQVEAAYDAIARAGSRALIVDLRGNEGGTFAVKPLLEHVIDAPLDTGHFVSRPWNASHGRLPTREDVAALAPWTGWSLSAFWRSVQEQGLLRIRMTPDQPNFDGPVFVVVDGRSASATELAATASGPRASPPSSASGPGAACSRRPSSTSRRNSSSASRWPIPLGRPREDRGRGVPVDVEVPSGEALERAKSLARDALGRGRVGL